MCTIDKYMKLPYTKIVNEMNDESGKYFYAEVLELDGCHTTADSEAEALEDLKYVMEDYIQIKLDNNIQIPEPKELESFSGNFVLRIPKSLHRRLSLEAKKEGISLNQYAAYKLSR